ncbi:MAG TPA: DUF748 domain-containing protein, partial [Candidatus Polarisedimenticolia bacterium]|nr:DUF748 domain-containing protein [Candidatus Polarisedimenticolia bacterium]
MGAEPDNAREGRKPARRRRWLFVAAILVALYAILGFLVAPAMLRHPLERQASALIGREVTLDRLRLNPFALSVTADGLHIKDKDGTPLLRWERLYLDFAALRSLWRREYCFGQIHLVGAAGRLAVLPGGALNIDDIVERVTAPAPGAPKEPGPPPVINVGRLRIEDASLGFVDRSTPATFTTTLGPMRIDLRDFTTKRGEGNEYTFRGSTEAGESFSWNGTFSLDPLGSDGSFTIENVTLAKYHPYYGGVVPFDIKDGQGDIRSGYRAAWGASNHVLALKGAAATVRNLKLSEHAKEEIAVDAPFAEVSEGDLDLMTGALMLGRFTARDGRIFMRKTKEGKVN